MKLIVAKNAGFCMGVRRAVELSLQMAEKETRGIATFGPLIHNPQVLQMLEDHGVKVLRQLPQTFEGTVIIRAHGVPPEIKLRLAATGATVKDATCPRVLKVQVIIDKYRKEGYKTIIIGDKNHAEVEGLMGHAEPDGVVVSSADDVERLAIDGPYIIVSQTTQDEKAFEQLSKDILSRFSGGNVFNTICDSTHKRQQEVREMCTVVDAMIVVGGANSANTNRLAEIARNMGCPVYLVETEQDLDMEALAAYGTVGITAGASTPTWLIDQVGAAVKGL